MTNSRNLDDRHTRLRGAEADLNEARAVRYFDAARLLDRATPSNRADYFEPLNFLLAMAGELTLKAFLMRAGMSDKELSGHKVRHSLSALLTLGVSRGLKTTAAVAQALIQMDEAHMKHLFRYSPPISSVAATPIFATEPKAAIQAIGELLDHCSPRPLDIRRHTSSGIAWLRALHADPALGQASLNQLIDEIRSYQEHIKRVTVGSA